jgi:hypothetical protein
MTELELSIQFDKNINANRKRVRLDSFDRSNWFKTAYSTFARTFNAGIKRGDEKIEIPNELEKHEMMIMLFNKWESFDGIEFDSFHNELVKELSNFSGMNIGRSQKLINILTKYLFVHKRLNPHSALFQGLSSCEKSFHVPIDTFVIFNLKDIPSFNGIILANRNTQKLLVNDQTLSWSKLNSSDYYLDFQSKIRTESKKNGQIPIVYEMENLWHPPN